MRIASLIECVTNRTVNFVSSSPGIAAPMHAKQIPMFSIASAFSTRPPPERPLGRMRSPSGFRYRLRSDRRGVLPRRIATFCFSTGSFSFCLVRGMATPFQAQRFIARQVGNIPPSGIREFFDVVQSMPDVISLGVGEPDFVTPWHIREAAIYALERGKTSYTSNLGLWKLRQAISGYVVGPLVLLLPATVGYVMVYLLEDRRRWAPPRVMLTVLFIGSCVLALALQGFTKSIDYYQNVSTLAVELGAPSSRGW